MLFEIFEISLSTFIFPPLSGDECDQVRKLNYHVSDYFAYAKGYFGSLFQNLDQGKVNFSKFKLFMKWAYSELNNAHFLRIISWDYP